MRAVIIAPARSGGTFFSSCLSVHPDIHCYRDEPLLKLRALGVTDYVRALDYVLDDAYYKVAMCKLTYDQAFAPEVRAYLLEKRPRGIHLVRAPLEVVTSGLLARQEKRAGGLRHVVGNVKWNDDETLTVQPVEVLRRMASLIKRMAAVRLVFAPLKLLEIDYSELTTPEAPQSLKPETATRVCRHLGVRRVPLFADNRKMHKRPLGSYYTNWDEVRAAIAEHLPDYLPEGL